MNWYRNDAVEAEIATVMGATKEKAGLYFCELLKFLDVCGFYHETCCPPASLDPAWHAFLVHTRAYEAYCSARYGRFIHHDPGPGATVELYSRTRFLAAQRFGRLDPTIWPTRITSDLLPDCKQIAIPS